jgi:hypothetical protein
MRAVLAEWEEPSFADLAAFVSQQSPYALRAIVDPWWKAFEAVDGEGQTVLAGDVWFGLHAREELDELEEFIEDLEGSDAARDRVASHLRDATAVVGLQILMSAYDDAVAAANAIIEFFEQRPGVLTQVDTVGWYDGGELILKQL